jgi:prepilin-type N-terminal cleavage/methylation domain-containing protein
MKTSSKCQRTGQGEAYLSQTGFTLIEIMIVVAIIGVVSAIAVPNYVKARTSSQVKACIANLKQINGVKSQWAIENKKGDNDTPLTSDLTAYLQGGMPVCPANGTYTIRRVASSPRCSMYSAGHTLANLDMDDDPWSN